MLLLLLACGPQDSTFSTGNEDDPAAQEGEAIAEIDPAALVWEDADVGFSSVLDLTIRSIGTGDLALYELSLLNDTTESFVFDRVQDVLLEPGEQETWPVTCDLESAITAEATIRVRTSDPKQNEVSIPLTCSSG